MSWRLAFHSTKLLFSYMIPYKMATFRDALIAGNLPLVRKLAAERPRLLQQAIDADGNTVVGLAIILENAELLKTVLEMGSNPNLANVFDGNHPLVILSKLRSDENAKTPILAEILLNAGSDPLAMVHHQADGATRIDATQTPWFQETPLLCAVRFQNDGLLKKFIEYGVDINYLNLEHGTSPLMLAAALGYEKMCNILIDAGADVNASDHKGNTPLHLATQGYGEKIAVIRILLTSGADPTVVNEDGFTPAILAKRTDNDACCEIIEESMKTVVTNESESFKHGGDEELFSFT